MSEKTNLEKRIDAIKLIAKSWIDRQPQPFIGPISANDEIDLETIKDDMSAIYSICRNIEIEDFGGSK